MQFENASTIHHWLGIGDGRYTDQEIVHKTMHDEKFYVCQNRIKATETYHFACNILKNILLV